MGDLWDKLKRRREIMSEISALNREKELILLTKEYIETSRLYMNSAMERWELDYTAYSGIELAPDIKVEDSFEGMAAEQLALDFPVTVIEISSIATEVSGVIGAIADQLTKIDEYVETLDIKIDELYARLAEL